MRRGKLYILLAVIFSLVTLAQISFAEQDKGPATIEINFFKDKKPAVQFKHKEHQEKAGDCKKCHHKAEEGKPVKGCHKCHEAKKDGKKEEAKKAYHKTCKDTCHKEHKDKKTLTKCDTCHAKK